MAMAAVRVIAAAAATLAALPRVRALHSMSNTDSWRQELSSLTIGSMDFLEESVKCTAPGNERTFSFKSVEVTGPFDEGKPISFLRWGDGDFECALHLVQVLDSNEVMLGKNEMCDRLGEDLREYGRGLGENNNLWLVAGTWWFCKESHPEIYNGVKAFFSLNETQPTWRGFANGWSAGGFYFPLLPDKEPGRKRGVVPRLQHRTVVLVGPRHLGKLRTMLNYTQHIVVPHGNAWEHRNELSRQVMEASKHHRDKNVVFLMAAGVATRPIAYALYKELGQKDSFIDVGASLDTYAGVLSRDFSSLTALCRDYPEYAAPGVCDDH